MDVSSLDTCLVEQPLLKWSRLRNVEDDEPAAKRQRLSSGGAGEEAGDDGCCACYQYEYSICQRCPTMSSCPQQYTNCVYSSCGTRNPICSQRRCCCNSWTCKPWECISGIFTPSQKTEESEDKKSDTEERGPTTCPRHGGRCQKDSPAAFFWSWFCPTKCPDDEKKEEEKPEKQPIPFPAPFPKEIPEDMAPCPPRPPGPKPCPPPPPPCPRPPPPRPRPCPPPRPPPCPKPCPKPCPEKEPPCPKPCPKKEPPCPKPCPPPPCPKPRPKPCPPPPCPKPCPKEKPPCPKPCPKPSKPKPCIKKPKPCPKPCPAPKEKEPCDESKQKVSAGESTLTREGESQNGKSEQQPGKEDKGNNEDKCKGKNEEVVQSGLLAKTESKTSVELKEKRSKKKKSTKAKKKQKPRPKPKPRPNPEINNSLQTAEETRKKLELSLKQSSENADKSESEAKTKPVKKPLTEKKTVEFVKDKDAPSNNDDKSDAAADRRDSTCNLRQGSKSATDKLERYRKSTSEADEDAEDEYSDCERTRRMLTDKLSEVAFEGNNDIKLGLTGNQVTPKVSNSSGNQLTADFSDAGEPISVNYEDSDKCCKYCGRCYPLTPDEVARMKKRRRDEHEQRQTEKTASEDQELDIESSEEEIGRKRFKNVHLSLVMDVNPVLGQQEDEVNEIKFQARRTL